MQQIVNACDQHSRFGLRKEIEKRNRGIKSKLLTDDTISVQISYNVVVVGH